MKLQTLKRIAALMALAVALTISLSLTGPKALADDHGDCQKRVERVQARLDDAVRKHGDGSHEAEKERHALNAERERCWQKYRGWWSPEDHRWHTEHDWDQDHDHDQR